MGKTSLIFCVLSCSLASLIAKEATEVTVKSDTWDYLVLAQFWPGTSCVYFGQEECLVPPKVNGWTIHGLWPSNVASDPPESCNDSMTFNYSEIQALRPALNKQWVNFNKSGDPTDLWSHEWNKHGTCAYDLPLLQGELKYFNATLRLHKPLNVFATLSKAKISPTKKKTFDLTDIFMAVVDKYNKTPQIVCCESEGKYYLEQIFLCYDKTLAPRDCPEVHMSAHSRNADEGKCFERSRFSALRFESEKPASVNSQAKTRKGYFTGCPDDSKVLYIPIVHAAEMATVEEEEIVYESFMERTFLP